MMSSEDSTKQFPSSSSTGSTTASTNALLGLNAPPSGLAQPPLNSVLQSNGFNHNILAAPVSTPQFDHSALFQSFHPALFDALQSSANGFPSALTVNSAAALQNGSAPFVPAYFNNLMHSQQHPHAAVNLNLNMTIQPVGMDSASTAANHGNAAQMAHRMHSVAAMPANGVHSPGALFSPAASSATSNSNSSSASSSAIVSDDPIFLFTVHFVSCPSGVAVARRDQLHSLSATRLLSSPLSLSLRQFFECSSRLLTMSRVWIESETSGQLFEYGRRSAVKSENGANNGKDDKERERKKKTGRKNEKNAAASANGADDMAVDDGNRRLIELPAVQEKVQKLVNSGQIKAYMHAATNLTPIHPQNDKRKRKTPVQRSNDADLDEAGDGQRHADIRILHREKGKNSGGKSDSSASREEKTQDDPDSSNQRDEDDEDEPRAASPSSSSSQQSLALSAFCLANVYIELLPTMKECRRLGCVYFMENNLQKSRRCCFYCQSGVELAKNLLRCYAPPTGLMNDHTLDRSIWNDVMEKTLAGLERDFWKFTAAPADERTSSTSVILPAPASSPASLPTMTAFGGTDGVVLYFMFMSPQIAQAAEEKFLSICQEMKVLPMSGGAVKKNAIAFRKVSESSQFFLKMKSHFWTFEVHSVVANPNQSSASSSSNSPSFVKQISVYRKIGKPNQNRRRSTKASASAAEKRHNTLTVKNEFTAGERRKVSALEKEKKSPGTRKGKGRSRDEDSQSESQSDNDSDSDNDNEQQTRNESQKKRKIEGAAHSNATANANAVAASASSALPSLFFLDGHDGDLSLQLTDRHPNLTVSAAEDFAPNLEEENERSTTSESENSSVHHEATANPQQQMHSHPFLQAMQDNSTDFSSSAMQSFLQTQGNEYPALPMLNDHAFFQSHALPQHHHNNSLQGHSQMHMQPSTAGMQRGSTSAPSYHSSASIPATLSSSAASVAASMSIPMSMQLHDENKHAEHELFFSHHEHSQSLTASQPAVASAAASSASNAGSTQSHAILSTLLESSFAAPPSNFAASGLAASSALPQSASTTSASSTFLSVPVVPSSSVSSAAAAAAAALKHEDEKRADSDSDEMDSVDSSFHSSPNLNISPQSNDGLNSSRPHSVQPPGVAYLNNHALLNDPLLAQSNIRSEVTDNHVSMSQTSFALLRHQRPVGAMLGVKDPNNPHANYGHLASVPVIMLYRDAATLLRDLDGGSVGASAGNSPINDGAAPSGDVGVASSGFVGGTFQHVGEVRVNVHAVPDVNPEKKNKKKDKRGGKPRQSFSTSTAAAAAVAAAAAEDEEDEDDADKKEDGCAVDESALESKQLSVQRATLARLRRHKDPFFQELRSNAWLRCLLRLHLGRSAVWLLLLFVLFSLVVFFQGVVFPSNSNSVSLLQDVGHPEISSALSAQSHNSMLMSWMNIRSASVIVDSWAYMAANPTPLGVTAVSDVHLNPAKVDQLCAEAANVSAAISDWIAAANSLPSATSPVAAQLSNSPPAPISVTSPRADIDAFCSAMMTESGRVYFYRVFCSSPLMDLRILDTSVNCNQFPTNFKLEFCLAVANLTKENHVVNAMFLLDSTQTTLVGSNNKLLPNLPASVLDGNSSMMLAATTTINFYAAQMSNVNAARAAYASNSQLWAALPQLVASSVQVNAYVLLLLQIGSYGLALLVLLVLSAGVAQITKRFPTAKNRVAAGQSLPEEEERLAVSSSVPDAAANSSLIHNRSQGSGQHGGAAAGAGAAAGNRAHEQSPSAAVHVEKHESKSSADEEDAEESGSQSLSLEFEQSMNEVSRFIAEKQKKAVEAATRSHRKQAQQVRKDRDNESDREQGAAAAAADAGAASEKSRRKDKRSVGNELEMVKRD